MARPTGVCDKLSNAPEISRKAHIAVSFIIFDNKFPAFFLKMYLNKTTYPVRLYKITKASHRRRENVNKITM